MEPIVTRTLEELRALMPVLEQRTHLFAGAVAPLAEPVRAELQAWVEVWSTDPMAAFDLHVTHGDRLRTAFAELIAARPDEVAVLSSTSEGANRIIGALAGEPREVVLVDETTFPTSIYPWLTKTDKRVEYVPRHQLGDPAWLGPRLAREDVLAVSLSHVGNTNGFRHDLEALATVTRPTGTLMLVDAAQSSGAIPIDVEGMGIDAMVTTTLKWMLGPPGIGLLYVRGDLMERLPLADVGYLRAQFEGPWPRTEVPDYPSVAATLELGIAAVPGLAAAAAGIDLIRSVGIDAIAGRIERHMARLVPELSERGFLVNTPEQPERRGGVLSARHPKAAEIGQWLADRRICIGGYPGGTVRIDPHGYNDDGDIDRLLASIDEFLAQEAGR